MGMESVYKLSVIVNMVDNLSGAAEKMSGATKGSLEKLNSTFGTMQKAGAIMTGAGAALTGVALKTVTATFDTQNALAELSSLGVEDLKAVEAAAKSFSDQWAGTSKADFITASYDIKSGISSLSDEGVAEFTKLAALTGKATKSTTEEMGSLFATGYGIYKGFYEDLSDMEFGEMFSAGISTAVKNYKTSGSQMAASISMLGATATNNNVPLEEQLAILGQLQTTMSGSEAATKYKSFLNQAARAGEALGLTFLDTNNQLLSMPEILTELKSKYGDTIDAVEKRELKQAFGTDEAVALIDLLYNNVETLDGGIQDLQQSMKSGISVTEEMAAAINDTPEQKFQVLKQQIHNNVEELGGSLLPVVNQALDKVNGLIQKGGEWISSNQDTIQSIMRIVAFLGVFLTIGGTVLTVVGTIGKAVLAAKNFIMAAKGAWAALSGAFASTPVGWIVLAIVALVAAFVVLWNKSEAFRGFWIDLFNRCKDTVMQAWQSIKPALETLGQKFMELYQALQPILKVLGTILGAVLTVALGAFVGTFQGIVASLTPVINSFSSLVEFITNIVNMVVSLFKGDFSGALDYASAAVGSLKDFIFNCFDGIISFLGGFADGFLSTIGGALSAVGIDASGTIDKIKSTVKNGLEAVKGFFGNILGAAADTVKEKLGNMKSAYEEHGGGIKGVAAAAVEGVKGYYTAGFTFIDNLTGGKLTEIKDKFHDKMSGVANAVSTGMSAAKNFAATQLSSMKAAYEEHGGGIKGAVAAYMTGVQNNYSTAYNAINKLTGGKLENIRSTITGKITEAKATVERILGDIQNAFTTKLEAARAAVSGAIEKIKGVFNFSWKLPDLKLPHISVTGGVAPYGIGGKGSLPKFDIQWYREGGILNGATIFGAMGGKMLGGGEAGAEAVLPLAELWKNMTQIVRGVVKGENEESRDDMQKNGASITSALTSKAASVRKEKETNTETQKEVYTSERWGKDGGTHINTIQFTVDISKIKDLPLLYKLIDELKDAQNRTTAPVTP